MTVTVKVICSPISWTKFSLRLAAFQNALHAETLPQIVPVPYWKEKQLLVAESTFSAQCTRQDVRTFFSLLCEIRSDPVLAENEKEIELGVLRSIPELLSDPGQAFVTCYAHQ